MNQQPWIPLCADTVTGYAWELYILLHACIWQTFFIQKVMWCIHRSIFSQLASSIEIKHTTLVSAGTWDVSRPKPQEQLISHASSELIILSNNQVTHPYTAHRKPPPSPLALPAALWPMAFSYWPCAARQKGLLTLLTGTAEESVQPSPKPLRQRRMTRNLLPSVAVSMGVRHQLIMAGVNGAGLGSSLEPSTWDCHQTIKSIIFSFRSQDLCNGLSQACMMATFIASLWKDNEWKGENRQKDLQHNNTGQ